MAESRDSDLLRMRKRLQAITFDVGGTLIEPWPSVGHVYAEVAARHGVDADADQLNRQFAQAWQAKSDFDYSRSAWSRVVSRTFGGRAEPLPDLPFFDELYERFTAPDVWRIYDDVLPALESLFDRGLKLAIVSNWDERLRPLLKCLKLDGYFDAVAVSCEVGFAKPSPVIFQEALKHLGVPADAVVHVGDSLEEDVRGALSAGCDGVLVARNGGAGAGDELRSLSELEAWLEMHCR